MIDLSTSAANEIKRLSSKQSNQNIFRLRVQIGGCSGLFYDLSFDPTVLPSDRVFNCHGIAVVIDTQSLNYVSDLTLDYSEDLMGGGFRFHNPQATSSCGCGNSFSIEAPTISLQPQ